ncbi:SNF2-related protein [Dokdonella sp.]|uniref:DEAD/DEAH box helicase n=1 Tax=Dokdonella sp. TaxID=2291710 RepID=UPI0031C9D814|nr:DEAD/DEAH box helicase [Dokdonella sp.]
MDRSTFRQLLSRHIGSLLDQHTLLKGAGYHAQGRVLQRRFSTDTQAGYLIGEVKGQARTPYETGIRVLTAGKADVQLDSFCTCPVQYQCKHVAALLLAELRGGPSEAAAPSADARLAAWRAWLEGLKSQAPAPAPSRPERICGIVLRRTDEGVLPGLRAQPTWFRPGKRGGLVAPQAMQRSATDPAPWFDLEAAAFQLVASVRMCAPTPGEVPGEWFALRDAGGGALLERLVEGLPCFHDKPATGRLGIGPTRALRIGWQQHEDGSQQLTLSVDGASREAWLLRVDGLWYLDPGVPELGRVDGEVRLAEAVLRAPRLLPEQVPLLQARWQDTPLLAALPAPVGTGQIERREVAPVPVVSLRAVPTREWRSAEAEIGAVRLAFDYGDVRLPATATAPVERRRSGERIIEVMRQRGGEQAAFERLEELGLEPAELFDLSVVESGALGEDDYVLERGRGQLAGVGPVFALAPRLRDLGFRLESADGFPFDLLAAPGEDAWHAEVAEESGSPWFDLRLGIDLDGERIDLLPLLHQAFADESFPLHPRKGEAQDATWLVALDERRRIPLPLAKLRALIAPLVEWLQTPPRLHQGALRLRRAQADVVEQLASGVAMPWRGGERLRAEYQRLCAPREPAHEPPGFGTTLRGYQRDGLAWLGFLADAGLGGILADDMGLGKTVQVLAHLVAEQQLGRLDRPALVIAPTSLVGNWQAETARFAPMLKSLVVHGPERGGLHAEIPQYDLVITTYPLLLRDRAALVAHRYSVLVLDEAQAIKNARAKVAKIVRELDARQRLAMTGTPLENHLGELWAELDAVEPGLLGDERHFNRFFRTPIEKRNSASQRERLKRRIAPLILRRRKEDVLAELPPKTEIIRHIELEGDQRALYETLRLAQHERVLAEVKKRGLAQSGIIVLDALLKLRQACCDPRLVKLAGARQVQESAKLDYLMELLDSLVEEGRRVLVFSQFTEMLALIATALDERGLAWQRLTGDTPGTQRSALVERFQAGEVPLFLISLKAGGVGLNLTAADTVVHYDPWWNPAVEAQATDRAHRIGQDKPVFVYKLICAGTVEEKIQALQLRKAELAEAVLDGGSSQSARFEEGDLAELFAPLA